MMAQSVHVCSFSDTAWEGVSGEMAEFEVGGVAAADDDEGGGVERREVEANVRQR